MRLPISSEASISYKDLSLDMLRGVEWKQIRSAFIRARGARTQAEVAKAGGLYQSDISKLEANDNLGPAVETFVNAIQGLGLSASSFFAQIDVSQTNPDRRGAPGTAKNQTAPQAEADHGGVAVSPDVARAVAKALIDAGTALATAAAGVSLDTPDRAIPSTRRDQSGRSKRRARNR